MLGNAALADAALADFTVLSPSPVGSSVAPNNDIFLCVVPAFSNRPDIRLEDPTKKCGGGIGYPFRHNPKELEKRTRKYGEEERRERLAELLAEAKQKSEEAKNKVQRKAINAAIVEAERTQEVDTSLLLAMEDLIAFRKVREQILAARHAAMIARARYEYEMEQDEEEALMLLLH